MAGLSTVGLAASAAESAAAGTGDREYYELRGYRLKPGAKHDLLDAYIEKAAIPALNRLGVNPVGVFVQQDRAGAPDPTEIRDWSTVWVLRTFPSLEVFAQATARLGADPEYQKAGAEYLNSPKSNPAFERIDRGHGIVEVFQPGFRNRVI